MFLTLFFSCAKEENSFTIDFFPFLEPLNKCMYVNFIQQCGGVLLIWVTVGQGPAVLPAAVGWGLLFKFFYFHQCNLFRSSSFLRKKAQDYNIVDWAVKPQR